MAVPTDLTQVSVTAASNSPSGSDAIGTSLDDFLRIIQAMLKEAGATLYTATGTDTITFNTTPTFSAYATGQRFFFVSAGANTGAVTLNINSLGAKSVKKTGTTALVAGDIPSGSVVQVVYDGTNFQLTNVAGANFGTSALTCGAITASGNVTLGDASTDTLNVGNGDLIKDASGNVGVGVTPSAWYSGNRMSEFSSGHIGSQSSGSFQMGQNAYINSSNAWVYKTTAAASFYLQTSGTHTWYTAPSGTAGNAITWTTGMTLDANGILNIGWGGTATDYSGNMVLNATSASGRGARLILKKNGTETGYIGNYSTLVSGTADHLTCMNTSGGVYLNGTSATSWTAVSDERFKENLEPITDAVAKVGTLRAVVGNYIESFDPTKTRKPFLIAQDVLAVLPEAVATSDPDRLGLSMTDTIPLLVAAIKELSVKNDALEARLLALETK